MEKTVWQGRTASGGKALGKLFMHFHQSDAPDASEGHSPKERERFFKAVNAAKAELSTLTETAKETLGEKESDIFLIHSLFLEDEDFLAAAERALQDTHSAEYALATARDFGIDTLMKTEDPVMMARSADLRDVAERVRRHLTGEDALSFPDSPFLYLSDDVTPSEMLAITKSACVGVILEGGSVNSHAAILAGAAFLPMLVKTAVTKEYHGAIALLDADSGRVILTPTEEEIARFFTWKTEKDESRRALLAFRDRVFHYPSGRRLTLAANIGAVEEYDTAKEEGAEGIGLFRSELLFLDATVPPDEEAQFEVYKTAVQKAAGELSVIRVMDFGADKIPAFLDLASEKNPALGLRGVRLFSRFPKLFESQLRALLRASFYGEIVILLPMVTDPDEVKGIKALIERLKKELEAEGKAVGRYLVGVMIETPAAAILAKKLAEVADYFSIGSNDLFQYTLAIDRENEGVARYADPHHDALLALIAYTVESAHERGIKVSLCGALAGDITLTEWLLSLKIDCLSLSPSKLLILKAEVDKILKNTP